jgi:hypothetical protein
MTNPVIVIYDAETGETIEREMNSQELAQYKADKAKLEAELKAETARENQRKAILDRLGLTAEEAQLLLGGN